MAPRLVRKLKAWARPGLTSNSALMTTVFALTQLVFLTLGTIFLKGMVHANGDITSSPYFQSFSFLIRIGHGFFCFPLLGLRIVKFPIRLIRVHLRPASLMSLGQFFQEYASLSLRV